MGFLFFVLVLLPSSLLLCILAVATKRKLFLIMLGLGWAGIAALLVIGALARLWFAKIELKQEDYYGSYVVDRSKFPGRQADWQYNTFRFDLRRNNGVIFYVTDKDRVVKTYFGTMTTVRPYSSHRLVLMMDEPVHHVMTSNPTTYRQGRHFYLVFDSTRFGNMFFIKGEWEPIGK